MTPHDQGLNCIPNEVGKRQPTGCYQYEGSVPYTNLIYPQVQTCEAEEICVETPYETNNPALQGATCQGVADCALCNGMFGLYANYDLEIDGFDCERNQYSFLGDEDDIPEADNQYGLCYKDATITSFHQFKSCEAIINCYDYASKNACENDPCFKFTDVQKDEYTNGCEWAPYQTANSEGDFADEVGVGVCRPQAEAMQNCNLCDKASPLGFCDEQMCGLYGECYYKDDATHQTDDGNYDEESFLDAKYPTGREDLLPTCLKKSELSCHLYETQDDCEGVGGQSSPIVLDVTYNSTGARIAGTNERLQTSNDTFHFGTCVWQNAGGAEATYGCHKDSDGSHVAPFNEYLDDCIVNNEETQTCYQDNEPPNTTFFVREESQAHDDLPTYGRFELMNEDLFVVADNAWAAKDIDTYIGIR
jgi:hypothetical protein